MALTPIDEVKIVGNKFYMQIAGKNTGFTLVDGSKLIVPNYQTAESQEKRKNNPRKQYTIESTQAMTAYEFADSISKTLRIPVGAANMIVMDQNNISSLDRVYTNFKVTTIGRKQPLTPEQESSLSFTEIGVPKKTEIVKKTETSETIVSKEPKDETPLSS